MPPPHPPTSRADDLTDASVHVAAGIILDATGAFLLTSRPTGKSWAGCWEFPGGKLETGESVLEALQRELLEEIGILIASGGACPWRTVRSPNNPHIALHFCLVHVWQGKLQMREGQSYAWCRIPPHVSPLLPSTEAVLQWLAQAQHAGLPLHLQGQA